MNDTETIFALALASNFEPQINFEKAYKTIKSLGDVQFSKIYLIPCRDGVGEDYWNSACLLKSHQSIDEIIQILKEIEQDSGRIRPSHKISLDVDLIAWGGDLDHMQFNKKKLPLPLDVKVPLHEVWKCEMLKELIFDYPEVKKCDLQH